VAKLTKRPQSADDAGRAVLLHSLSAAVAPDPPVRVWFNSDGHYEFGDRAKVYAQSAEDGYLVVLRADAQGHVRVLFPIDPDGNQQIRGDKKEELKGRGGREAFVVDDTLRHFFAQQLAEAGAPESRIQQRLRHRSVTMTRRYTRMVNKGENARTVGARLIPPAHLRLSKGA